ncbi:MAG: hypothetical protein WC349_03780 [Patescibacteria group bacterium]
MAVISGCGKRALNNTVVDESEKSNTAATTSDISSASTTELNIIKKISLEDTKYNHYKSDKYFFEVETPKECFYKEFYSRENYPAAFLFDCFGIDIIENKYFKPSPKNEEDFYDIQCGSPEGIHYSSCVKNTKNNTKRIKIIIINGKEIVNAVVGAGRDGFVMNSYYFVTDKYIYTISMSFNNIDMISEQNINELESIVKSFVLTN